VSFFEPPPSPPKLPQQSWRQPAWLGPPDNVMGGVVGLGRPVARSHQAAVWIATATAFPSGVEFALELRWRPEMFEVVSRGAPWHYRPSEGGELPDELFRAGFQFPDGSKVTTLSRGLGLPAPTAMVESGAKQEPEGPVLMPRGGGGGAQSWSHGLWLWPLPEAEPLSFVCEWPALGIVLTRTEIDLAPIHDAAGRSQLLWEDDGPPVSGFRPVPHTGS
jgi:hypothetical protein